MLELLLGALGRADVLPAYGVSLTVLLLGPVVLNIGFNLIRLRSRSIPRGRVSARTSARTSVRTKVSAAGASASGASGDPPAVTVLIPARNEEHNLPRLLDSLSRQTYPEYEVLVYDDGSEDGTWKIIQSRAGVMGVRGSGPPDGWYGKVHALYQLSEHARGDILLFLDADTELRDEGALERLVERFQRVGGELATGITRLRGRGHILVSVIGYAILSSIPWWMGSRLPSRFMAAVNGQCWMIDAGLYRRHRPHLEVRSEVLEDVMIGRYMYGQGVRPRLMNAQKEVSVHMYSSFSDAWTGFRKNAYAMVGGTPVRALPLWTVYTTLYVVLPLLFAPALIATTFLKLVSDRFLGVGLFVSLAAPLSFILAAVLILDSAVSTETGTVRWKGRRLVSRSAGAAGS